MLTHLNLMVLYAALLGIFFAVLWRRSRRDQVRLFSQIFLGLLVGAIVIGWLMYPFPSGPPAPIP